MKIVDLFRNNKLLIITLIILIYGFFLRFYIPFHIPIHENNHGIFFINGLLDYNFSFKNIVEKFIFIREEFIEQMNYGLIPKLLYGFLISNLGFSHKIIYIAQIILSLFTVLFFSLLAYKISSKKLLYYVVLILGIVLPYNIKFASTDEFLVMGNFFLSVSLYLYVLFFLKEKYRYFYSSIIFYILALYTRNLYLIFSIFYLIGFLYFLSIKRYNYKKIFINFFIGLSTFLVLTLSRIKVFILTENSNLNFSNFNFFNVSGFFTSTLIPFIYLFLLISGILLPIYFLRKQENKYRNIIFYYIFISILITLLLLLISTSNNFLLLERLQNIFVPFFILLASIGLFLLIFKFRYNSIILFLLLMIPFFYINNIKNIYSPQEDYLFIENNINKIGNNFNLVILGFSDSEVFNNFPEFLIKDSDYEIYGMSGKDKRYKNFNEKYDEFEDENNYFILSYDCYRGNNIGKYMRKECEFIEDNYFLETVTQKYIENKPYIFNNSSNEKKLKIGIYKIIYRKDVKDNA